jgi:hypothetical protein
MNKEYLNKVIDQLAYETEIDYDEERFLPPFFNYFSHNSVALFSSPFSPYPSFIEHCRDVYGLNPDEIKYVWKEYRDIIKDKIENNE